MADALNILNAKGERVAVDLHAGIYREAAQHGQSVGQYLANMYPTDHKKYGSPLAQLMEQSGLYLSDNPDYGIRAATVGSILNPQAGSTAVTKDGIATSRLLFPAVMLDVIEDKLQEDLVSDSAAFDSMVAVDDSINGEVFERPVLHYADVEKARSMPVAQLAMPNAMLSITASDTIRRIPTFGIGVEISDQARNLSVDLLALAIARQAAVERNHRAQDHILSIYAGDEDAGMAALSTMTGQVATAKSFDSALTTAGTLSQKAWLKWLSKRSRTRTIDTVIGDIDAYLAWEARAGRPQSNDNINGVNNANTMAGVMNKKWPGEVRWFITDNPNWPANTIVGFDSRYGLHRVKSLTANYQATEEFVIKRSTQMRVDSGELVYRLFDEAFDVLTLTV